MADLPYGSWPSPITAEMVATGGVRLDKVSWSGNDLYWLEGRSWEGGRYVIVRRDAAGTVADVFPAGFNARTLAHEYGGGSYWVHGESVFFANFEDQRLYRVEPGLAPTPITAAPELLRGDRYADGVVTPDGRWIVCVRERHGAGAEAVNELVILPTDGSAAPRAVAGGHDFFAFPRLSPDGRWLAWTCWDHPNMPWDGTVLMVASLAGDGTVGEARPVAGGPEESIFQPQFSPAGILYFISDRTGWWNLYADAVPGQEARPVAPIEAELGVPQWVFGLSTYAFLASGALLCLVGGSGGTRLCRVAETAEPEAERRTTTYEDLGLPFRSFSPAQLVGGGGGLAFLGGSPERGVAVVAYEPVSGATEIVRESLSVEVDPSYISVAEPIAFPSTYPSEGAVGHALYYPPVNPHVSAPAEERPPLVVMSHGGPTSATSSQLRLETQYFTSRGFAVVDVNYGGSTGYGRAYRDRLKGRWGVLDVDDCIGAAQYLVERGDVDGKRLAIRGGSAGGYTTLCALTFRDVFSAGASYYGVADAETLAQDTHKFESRYLDSLIGPYPEAAELYRERSPIHFTDRLSCPLIILQGLEDKVVPPAQAQEMVAALQAKGLPFAYLPFEGEQHGFRRAETIQRALEAEAYFYAKVFGFSLADDVDPVAIENLPE
ncbi:MAG TPA: prolyl oligopeptidase family serine peptidase [Actinomycetota bacterium]|nr:prolyl oligopeptidase family serine peptidase [Actinomycetota bacterium]